MLCHDDWLTRTGPTTYPYPHFCRMRHTLPEKWTPDRQTYVSGGHVVRHLGLPMGLPNPPRTP
uniref:Uncharacterized protein n=1 Tax=Helianthus annuus TaxID=4232 RepID=A0A251STJ5_HELAN